MGAFGGNMAGFATGVAGCSGARALSPATGGTTAKGAIGGAVCRGAGAGPVAGPGIWAPGARAGGGGSGPSTVAHPASHAKAADAASQDNALAARGAGRRAICAVGVGQA